jgi:uncharacterized protein YbjT (DUF2867 family)
MFIVLGGTGHVGAEVTKTLLDEGKSVTIVTRSEEKAKRWEKNGAKAAVVDVNDRQSLAAVFREGERAFLLNPSAPVSTDTDVEEHRTVQAIVAALTGSGLKKVVVESTYGAQPGDRCGDLNVLYDFEQALAGQPTAVTVQRAAYYMSNWDEMLEPASAGTLPSMFPENFVLPMVAPSDLGQAAARFLLEPQEKTGIHYVEGPERYSINDVAHAFSKALGKPVKVAVTPREEWVRAYKKLGFSEAAAKSYARMTAATLDGPAMPEHPVRGTTTLQSYINALVQEGRAPATVHN